MLDRGAEDLRVRGAVDGHHRLAAVATAGAQQGDGRPVVLGHLAYDPRALGSAAIPPGQGPLDARCIDKLQAPDSERRTRLAVDRPRLLDARRVARRGVE